jgi:hypothetical protein
MTPKEQALWMLDASEVRAGQTWRHVKTGNRYTVIATGLDEATLAPVIVYSGHDGVVWVRTLEVFTGNTEEGKARFLLVTEETEPQTAPFVKAEKLESARRRCCLASSFPPFDHSLDCTLRSMQGVHA